jgi:hypothetical protein
MGFGSDLWKGMGQPDQWPTVEPEVLIPDEANAVIITFPADRISMSPYKA